MFRPGSGGGMSRMPPGVEKVCLKFVCRQIVSKSHNVRIESVHTFNFQIKTNNCSSVNCKIGIVFTGNNQILISDDVVHPKKGLFNAGNLYNIHFHLRLPPKAFGLG